jgi:hypothetical protein
VQDLTTPQIPVQSDSERDEFEPSGEGSKSMTCDGCHTLFEYRRCDPYPHCYSTSEDDDHLPPGLLARHVQRQKPGPVYVVQSAGRIRIGKACSSQRYKSYERSFPHGCELLKVWESANRYLGNQRFTLDIGSSVFMGPGMRFPDQKLKELLSLSPNGEP